MSRLKSASRVPTLEGKSVRLRAPVLEDSQWRQALGHNPDITRMFGGFIRAPKSMTRVDAESWVQHLIDDPYAWIIDAEGSGIGEARLHHLNQQDQTASLAIGILDSAKLGRGLGCEAVSLLVEHAFNGLGLHRLSARVLAFNERAIGCYQSCGFFMEDRERESCRIGVQRYDDLVMGLLATDSARRLAADRRAG